MKMFLDVLHMARFRVSRTSEGLRFTLEGGTPDWFETLPFEWLKARLPKWPEKGFPDELRFQAHVGLNLKWGELLAIIAIFVSLETAVVFRQQIAGSHLINGWARFHRSQAGGLVAAMTLLLGVALAVWKSTQLFVYGLFEIAFGTYSSFQAVALLWSDAGAGRFLAIGSSLYVISRGVGNVLTAYEREKGKVFMQMKAGSRD
ncbi:MAG: hypothetical protein ACRYGF_02395 [Janthinobacterium lividum]